MYISEIEVIERALKRLRTLAYSYRYAGLMNDYVLAQEALAALERIRDPQLSFEFGGADVDTE